MDKLPYIQRLQRALTTASEIADTLALFDSRRARLARKRQEKLDRAFKKLCGVIK